MVALEEIPKNVSVFAAAFRKPSHKPKPCSSLVLAKETPVQ